MKKLEVKNRRGNITLDDIAWVKLSELGRGIGYVGDTLIWYQEGFGARQTTLDKSVRIMREIEEAEMRKGDCGSKVERDAVAKWLRAIERRRPEREPTSARRWNVIVRRGKAGEAPAPPPSKIPLATSLTFFNLSAETIGALRWIARRHFCNAPNPDTEISTAARTVLKLALAHPQVVNEWAANHVRYRVAEGFAGSTDGDELVMVARIGERPEYRKIIRETKAALATH